MKNNYYLLSILRAIWKQQLRRIFVFGVVVILLGLASSNEMLGQTTILTENFGTSSCGLPAGWSDTGADPFIYTAPNYSAINDHTTGSGCFAAHDDSGDDGNGELVSPSMDLSGASSATLTFWYVNNAQSTTSQSNLRVDISTDGGTTFTNDQGVYNTSYTSWTEITLSIPAAFFSSQTVIRFRTVESNNFYSDVSIDDIEVTALLCTPPAATPTIVADCANAQFSIDVNVTLNDATAVDITNDADAAQNVLNAGAGVTTIGPFAAGTDVIIALEGTAYGGCDATLTAVTEACACSTLPMATVTSNAPDCGVGTFDIDVNITDLGGGTTANTGADIFVNGVLESSNVGLGITTINKPVGTYTVYVEGIGGTGFATCVTADETATAGCTNDVCADAFVVTTDGTPTTSIDVSNYTNTPNNSCEHHLSNENTADAWYSFVAPASGMVSISVDNTNLVGSGYESEAVLYDDCTLTSCTVDWIWSDYLENGNVATGLTSGATYYLVVSNQQNQGGTAWTSGTFDVRIEDFAPPLSLGVKSCSQTFLYLDSPIDEKCPSSCSWFTDSDADAIYTYTPATTGTVDIKISDISDGGETLQELGFIFTSVAPFDADGSCAGEACHSSPLTTDLEANGISVTGGTTYYLYVAYDGFDSTPSATFCATISSPCTGTTETIATPTFDCTAQTYTGRINFTALGGATTYELEDDMGTVVTGVTTATDYDFNYTDLNAHTVALRGYDGSGNLVCTQDYTLTSNCNGSDAFSLTAPNILGTCYPGDLSVATVGATGFTPLCDGSFTGGSTGNNVIRDCSNANFDNNTDFIDLWYQVDLPDGTDEMTLTVTGLGTEEILGYVLHTADPAGNAGDNVATVDGNLVCSFFDLGYTSHTITGLADESTAPIYIRILAINFNDNDGCAGMVHPDFTICASAPQPNDICNDASDIDGVSLTGDLCQANTDAENSENCETTSNCSPCALAPGGTNDLWYEVTMNAADNDQMLEVDLTFPNADDAVIVELYSNCFSHTFEECATVSSTGAGSTINHAFSTIITAGGSGPTWYVRVTPVAGNSVCSFTIQGNRVAENNLCDIANQTFPTAFTITNPVLADFQFATPSNVDGQTDSDLWYVFDPEANTDAYGHNVYSTEADVLVSGLAAGEEITIMLYKRRSSSSDLSCINYADDYLSTLVINGDGTSTLSCLDEIYGTSATSEGYIIRILQTAGSTDAAPTVTVTPSTDIPPFNNSCENIWDGNGPAILGSTGIDAAHGFNAYYILNGETQTGNFSGATDCDSTIPSGMCNGVDYEAITESNDRDMWYVFTVPDNECATLGLTQSTVFYSMDITYNANSAFRDGIVYIYSDCDASSLVDCSGALDGAGTTWTANGLTQGESYLLRVKPWDISSTPTDWSFDISVNDGNPAPCNDFIENAEGLTVNTGCASSPWYPSLETFSALGASDEETFGQNDVFFSFTAPLPPNGGAYNPQTNATYPGQEKSWVNVFLENVSGHIIQMELWNTQQIVATATQYSTSSTAGDKIWARFGNLEPGATYELRLYHGETITTDVQYKIRLEAGDNVTSTTECNAGDIKATPVLCGSCGGENSTPYITDPAVSSLNSNGSNNHCEMWYKIDLPVMAGGSGTYWVAEVRGVEQVLDFELRQQIATESLVHGVQEDFDHPCSSRPLANGNLVSSKAVTYEVDPGPVYNNDATTPTPYLNAMGTESQCQCVTGCSADEAISRGGGFRKVYSDILGPAAGTKNYLYLRVFMDEDDPAYTACHDGGVLINPCQVIFKGPYSVDPTLDAGGNNELVPGEPDLECSPTISFVSETSTVAEGGTIEVCVELQGANGNVASADIILDAVDAGTATNTTDYTIANPALPFTATFPASASSGDTLCFTINAINDNPLSDPNEIINFDLENPVGATLGTIMEHTTTITESATGSISGNVFLDLFANGLYDGSDTDIEGITVTLTNMGDATTMTMQTLADGSYSFTGLADGNYMLTFGTTDAAAITYDAFAPQDAGSNDLIDSEVNASGTTNIITISANNITDIDAGMYEYITISGALFTDNDGTVGTTPAANGTTETIIVTYCDDMACSSTTNVSYLITTTGNTFSITDAAPGIISAVNSTNYNFEEASVINTNTLVASGATVVEQDFAQQVNLPNAVDDTTSTPTNTPVTIINLANDTFGTDGPNSSTITIITNGTNGIGIVNDGGTPTNPTDDTITYTPNTNFVGTDTLTYQICDSTGDCDTAVITITISNNCNANAGDF